MHFPSTLHHRRKRLCAVACEHRFIAHSWDNSILYAFVYTQQHPNRKHTESSEGTRAPSDFSPNQPGKLVMLLRSLRYMAWLIRLIYVYIYVDFSNKLRGLRISRCINRTTIDLFGSIILSMMMWNSVNVGLCVNITFFWHLKDWDIYFLAVRKVYSIVHTWGSMSMHNSQSIACVNIGSIRSAMINLGNVASVEFSVGKRTFHCILLFYHNCNSRIDVAFN